MHIPKTAGLSVLVYLRSIYPEDQRLELRWQDNSLRTKANKESVARVNFIWLHEPLSDLPYNTDPFFKITFLRHPVERIQSVYTYLRNPDVISQQNYDFTPGHVVGALRAIEHMTFEEFVLSEDPVHVGHSSNLYGVYFRTDRSCPHDAPDHISQYLRNMENFDYVGTTRTLDADMNAIKSRCFPDCSNEFADRRENASKKSDVDFSLSRRAKSVLEQKIAVDLSLYEHAEKLRKIHHARWAPYVPKDRSICELLGLLT